MTKIDVILKNKKKERLKINNINEFREALKKEGYNINDNDEEKFKKNILETFKLNKLITEKVYECINNEITYRADNIKELIEYIEKIVLFEKEHNRLCEKIGEMEKIYIDRIEYEREISIQDDVEHIIKAINEIKSNVSSSISEEEYANLEKLEKELDKDYVYAKDIELLKKMIILNNDNVKENYDEKTKTRTLFIEVPQDIQYNYIPSTEGSVEYHKHISSNIPRMQRLIKNINKYIEPYGGENKVFRINQSEALQDSINIAVATYDNNVFKAISGKNDIKDYCAAPRLEKTFFKSSKVNKLGKLGIGYNRVNDSEKKIFEEIHKQIEEKKLKDSGELILYSKWEPCPSCYYVISQFCKSHPNIKVQIKYSKKYGEQ